MYHVVMPAYLFIVFTLMVLVQDSICQLTICNSFTQHVISLWRDITSELWTPVLFSLLLNQSPQKICLLSCNLLSAIYFSATILHPLDTFNPLCSAKPVSLTTSLNSWGKVICCLCVGFHVALMLVEAPCHCHLATPSEATHFSYWSIKPWFYY